MGNINNVNAMGSNQLIKDGAIPVTSYIDILSYYNEYNNLEVYQDDEYDIPESEIIKIPAKKLQENAEKQFIHGHRYDVELEEEGNKIYHILGTKPKYIDEIALEGNMPIPKVSLILAELETKELVVAMPGRQYKIK